MKKDQIRIGGTYLAKVTDKVVPVRLDAQNPHGGWEATNLATNKRIRIKSAQKLRGWAPEPAVAVDRNPLTPVPAEEAAEAERRADRARADGCRRHDDAAPAADPDLVPITKLDRDRRVTKTTGMSCIDAAAEVLKAAGGSMNTKAMIEAMGQAHLWSSTAPTPSATLYAAILREIKVKGAAARFRKVERGQFALVA
jgi:hypothetical protein